MEKNNLNKFPKEVILWGGTGQAKVVRPIIEHYGSKVIAVIDDTPDRVSPFPDVPIYKGYDGFKDWYKNHKGKEIGFCIAIGNPHGRIRIKLAELLKNEGLIPISLAHPSAVIAGSAVIGEGAQILAGAIIQPETIIGKQCIINTKASVDHECKLADGVEIAPGATVCGTVTIKENAWVAAGAVVLPWLTIGQDAIVGAGSLVLKDVEPGTVVVGNPAKFLRKV